MSNSQKICNFKVINFNIMILSMCINHSSMDFLYCDNNKVKQVYFINQNFSQLQNTTSKQTTYM